MPDSFNEWYGTDDSADTVEESGFDSWYEPKTEAPKPPTHDDMLRALPIDAVLQPDGVTDGGAVLELARERPGIVDQGTAIPKPERRPCVSFVKKDVREEIAGTVGS